MEKEKSTKKSNTKKVSRKTSLPQPAQKVLKSGKKASSSAKNEGKEFDDVESLVLLSNPTERKKRDGIDDRIKLLKMELKSLLGGVKTSKNFDGFVDERNLVSSTLVHVDTWPRDLKTDMQPEDKWVKLQESQINKSKEFKPKFNSTPSKFSELLDKTIDEMNSKSQNIKLTADKSSSNLGPEMDQTDDEVLNDSRFTSFGIPSLSQEKVEQLLYNSFLIQNSDACLLSSEAGCVKQNRSILKTKRQIFGKKLNRKPDERHLSPHKRFPKRGVKRRMLNANAFHRDIEVISLDSSPVSNKVEDPNPICVELDISNYNWSEPFDINNDTQFYSDAQVIEESEEMNEFNSPGPEVTLSEAGVCPDDSKEILGKKVWECPVCFERSKGQEVVATQCGHVFCRKCLEDHISKVCNDCPTCRSSLRGKPFITLFNF